MTPPTSNRVPVVGSHASGIVLPSNVEAERAVLGSILLDQAVLDDVQSILRPDDFSHPPHQVIYESIVRLSERGLTPDLAFLRDELERSEQLALVGGIAYIASLEHYVVTSAAAPDHARRVAEKARLRRLIQTAQGIIQEASTEQDTKGNLLDTPEIIERAEKAVFEVGRDIESKDFVRIEGLCDPALQKLEAQSRRKSDISGIATFFTDLDNYTSGFHPSEFIILAARPSIGKTALAINIALQVAKGGKILGPQIGTPHPVGIFSLEMSRQELTMRLLSSLARVPGDSLRTGSMSREDFDKIQRASDMLKTLPFFIDDTAALTPTMLRSKARRLKAQEPQLALIVVDYLQLMRGTEGRNRQENRQQEVSEISRSLKALARELEIPILVLSQLSRLIEHRAGKGKAGRPVLSDLRESGALEQDADVVMFIHRERTITDKDDQGKLRPRLVPDEAEIIIGKQRNGPTGPFTLMFLKECTTFYDASKGSPPLPGKR